MIDINQYVQVFHDACPNGTLAVLVRGSYAHGCATSDSDVDLLAIVPPTSQQILLGETGQIVSLHEPDVTIMSPLAYARLLAKGAPNIVETLTIPSDCVLVDSPWLEGLRAHAFLSVSKGMLRMVCGNVRANLHRLDAISDARRQRKLLGETWRLIVSANTTLDTGVWPARLGELRLRTLRSIRCDGCDPRMLHDMSDRLHERVEASDLLEKNGIGGLALDSTVHLYRRIVQGDLVQVESVDSLVRRLRRFMEGVAVGS